MDNSLSLNIDKNIINVFTSKEISIICRELNIKTYYYLEQIHSNIVHIVDNNYQNNSQGDALITNKLNTPLVIKIADCIPIILYDKENKVISVIHSGWKGTLNHIVLSTIQKMQEEFNSLPQNIFAYLYPSIRKCHFEVDIDVYNLFKKQISNINKYTTKKENKYYLDLQEIVITDLKNKGIKNITDTSICTYCNHSKYYSYRYNQTKKRNILIAIIKE